VTHDEIAEVAFHTIIVCQDGGVTDPLRIAHAIAVALKLAEDAS
jgi:hypothetical protein